MIFHENRLLADDSHEKSYLFLKNWERSKNLSTAVVIGALRVKWSCSLNFNINSLL